MDRQKEEVLIVSYILGVSEHSITIMQYFAIKKETKTFPHFLLLPVFTNIAQLLRPTRYHPSSLSVCLSVCGGDRMSIYSMAGLTLCNSSCLELTAIPLP